MMETHDVLIIGGGPAGLACAVELHKQGVTDMLVVEREAKLGGILRQCIHDGFGLTRFGESLSGPEYAGRFIEEIRKRHIPYVTDTTVLSVSPDRVVTTVSPSGMRFIKAKAVVFAMGCRERTRGSLAIAGERPSGVFTAGVAQSYINLYNKMVGKEVVILGSGDIGMIMARRLTLEGAHVQAVFEILPMPSGLPRNVHQCLEDYGIPLYLSHTITDIHGASRLTGVTVSEVDGQLRPIPGTEKEYACDTLILSVGLIPENELTVDAGIPLDPKTRGADVDEYHQTEREGFFAAGNVLHVHDLVDFVSLEAEKTACSVAEYVAKGCLPICSVEVVPGQGVGHVVPQRVSGERDVTFSLRANRKLSSCSLEVLQNGVAVMKRPLRNVVPAVMLEITVPKAKLSPSGIVEVRLV